LLELSQRGFEKRSCPAGFSRGHLGNYSDRDCVKSKEPPSLQYGLKTD
jgi:hypothetical protein